MSIFIVLLTLHICFAAALFGVPLGLSGSCRRALAIGQESFQHAATEAARKGKITGIMAVLTLLSGLTLIMYKGGFALVSPNIHTALTLMLLHLLLAFLLVRPAAAKLVEASQGEAVDTDLAEKSLKKLGMGSGILQLNWLLMLFLMNFSF